MSGLNLYLVSRTDNWGMDEYSAFVVCASSEEEAKLTHPYNYEFSKEGWLDRGVIIQYDAWVDVSQVDSLKIKLLGTAVPSLEKGIICSSYHAG